MSRERRLTRNEDLSWSERRMHLSLRLLAVEVVARHGDRESFVAAAARAYADEEAEYTRELNRREAEDPGQTKGPR